MSVLRLFSDILLSRMSGQFITRSLLKCPCNQIGVNSLNWTRSRFKHAYTVKDLIPKEGVLQSHLVDRSENEKALTILKSSPSYKETFFSSTDVSLDSCPPILKEMASIASSPEVQPLCSDVYKEFRSKLIENIPKLPDKELAIVLNELKHFPKSVSANTEEYQKVWKALDNECNSRLPTWNVDFALLIDHLWYDIYLSRFSDFHWALKRKLFRKCSHLTKEQYVRFALNLIVGRTIPAAFNTYDLEHKLYSIVDELSLEETMIVALAFFKTETRIKDSGLVRKLLLKAFENPEKLDSISTASIAKLARHSSNGKFDLVDFYHSFQEKYIPEIDRLSITACTHLILIGSQLHVFHKGLIKKVMDKVETQIEEIRLKDFERLIFVMTTYDSDCDSLCYKIVDELRKPSRQEEVAQYGRCLPSILHYLSFRKIFPLDWIFKVLSPEFVAQYFGKSQFQLQRDLLSLDMTVGIELPDYQGPRLEEKRRSSILKYNMPKEIMFSQPNKKVTKYETVAQKIENAAIGLFGGSEFVHACSILPQFHSSDVIFCTDEQNKLIPIPNWIKEKKVYEPKFVPENSHNSGIIYHALFIVKRGAVITQTGELLGNTQLQLRQLKQIGYTFHVVNPTEWMIAAKSDISARKFLAELILTTSPAIRFSLDVGNGATTIK